MRLTIVVITLLAAITGALAQQQAPTFATTQVEGTPNVYVFRYQNHQSMFVVTPAGVIATDPISYGRPQAAKTYVEEIRKITQAPIKYLIYSHHHLDRPSLVWLLGTRDLRLRTNVRSTRNAEISLLRLSGSGVFVRP